MLDKIKKLLKSTTGKDQKKEVTKPAVEKPAKKRPRKKKEEPVILSPKDLATQNSEPYINIVSLQVDSNDVNNGLFELDWNEKFVLNLVRAGYKIRPDDTDQQIVDRWFQTVCRNIALEMYEQYEADPENRDVRVIKTRDIGNGRTEVS